MKKYFNKTNKKMSLREKFDYIHNHFYYYTLNSWNKLESLANNVKIYNLPLTHMQRDKFFNIWGDEMLCSEMYEHINNIIYDFETEHKDFQIFFNGRSGGYLVITNKKSNGNIINDDFIDFSSYEELIENLKEYYSYQNARQNAKFMIEETFNLVVMFDNLCDSILKELIYILDNAKVEEEEIEYTTTKRIKYLKFED